MMDKAGTYIKGAWGLTNHILKSAIAGTILTLAFTACTHHSARADLGPNIGFEYQQNDRYSLSYSIAWNAMKEVYAPSIAKGAPGGNPLIGIGEVKLNSDEYPEIIAFPTEEEEEVGQYCKNDVCPHYVLEVRDKKVHTLGVIFADTIALGDGIADGYWELLAYKDGNKDPKKAVVYQYSKNKDQYLPKPQSPAKP
jgi:hypothetical protein